MTETAVEPKKPRGPRGPVKPYYRAMRKLTFHGKTYKRGQVVPGAGEHSRVEALVRGRHLELVE